MKLENGITMTIGDQNSLNFDRALVLTVIIMQGPNICINNIGGGEPFRSTYYLSSNTFFRRHLLMCQRQFSFFFFNCLFLLLPEHKFQSNVEAPYSPYSLVDRLFPPSRTHDTWLSAYQRQKRRQRCKNLLIFVALFVALFLLLSLWSLLQKFLPTEISEIVGNAALEKKAK